MTEPDATQPESPQPQPPHSDATRPDATRPDATQPEAWQPGPTPPGSSRYAVDRNPTTVLSGVLVAIALLILPFALFTSLWGGYGGSTGIAIGEWVVVILLLGAAGGMGLMAPRTRTPLVVGCILIVVALLEAIVLVVNLPGGHLREALAVIFGVLLGLGGLFIWQGLKRP